MIKEIRYINLREMLSRVLDHPLLQDVTLEAVIKYTVKFIGIFGLPGMYEEKIADVEIEDFRGLLPCDLISIKQVKDPRADICLRAMTDSFGIDISREPDVSREPAFLTKGRVIFTTLKKGVVKIAYKAIPVDQDGLPLLIDNENYLEALELFIQMKRFKILFDQGKISYQVYDNTRTEYSWRAAQLEKEFIMPSESEMEAIARSWTTLIPRMKEFDKGFRDLGNREYIRNQ